jgi:hypothetical protein
MTHSRYLLAAFAMALSAAACDTPNPLGPAEAVNDDLTAVLASASSIPAPLTLAIRCSIALAKEIPGLAVSIEMVHARWQLC